MVERFRVLPEMTFVPPIVPIRKLLVPAHHWEERDTPGAATDAEHPFMGV